MIWNFPISISQTRLGDRVYASSACALISVAMAENIFRKGIHLPLWNGVQVVDIDAARFPSKQNNNNRRFATKQNVCFLLWLSRDTIGISDPSFSTVCFDD